MRRIYLLLSVFTIGVMYTQQSSAQCVSINNLPDTITACKNTTVQLSATISSPGLLQTLDTTWTPSTGLSDPNIINPVATIGTSSIQYKLTVSALTANNFVVNGNFDNGATGFTTSYIPGNGGSFGLLSNAGTYAVTTNPSLVHTNFASFADHTGNPGGKMMVINGASTANTSVWCQTITVLPNTDYDFSAWAASCVNSAPASLQFSINGILLGSPLNLSTTTGAWSQFHAIWSSGSNTSITICIVDQQTAASGNDFAIDDIAFRQICYVSDSVYINVTNLKPGINRTIKLGCTQDTVDFTAVNNGGDQPTLFTWTFGDNTSSTLQNPQHIYTTQGQYTIKLVTRRNGCKDSASINIDTRHPLQAKFVSDKDTVCLGTPIKFVSSDVITGNPTYYWNFGDNTTDATASPTHNYTAPGVYHVVHVAKDPIPCTDTARKTVLVLPGPAAAFTATDTTVCVGQTVVFTSNATPGWDTLMYNFGDGSIIMGQANQNHAYDIAGNFVATYTVGYKQCPTIIKTKNIQVFAFPQVNLGPDTAICPNADPLLLTSLVTGSTSLLWSTEETTPTILIKSPGTYWLTASTPGGCNTTDSIWVRNDCYLDIPNAFSPNGDGVNDYFFPRQLLSSSLHYFRMQIFNRWGGVIYETTHPDGRGWDGRFNDVMQPQGVYIYQIEAQIGTNPSITRYHGNVTLLR